ncbi:hypothetical protein EPUS_07897 [Endocarpon pusillum Z07020]|uniref:Uncharacterized protein n=1 Tax=Endocarpon pusillum (strain Z07020 / HMAS-L-300199) TaxID=1263415 RepID=U1HQ75_ENDPU|nr:uncharacterized protein EPUS_07897 [Endocarpon pusillum Z07020]ERF71214.1 hypothetical protein EPUS_07897 [Endocarpon pusillum Z07020]
MEKEALSAAGLYNQHAALKWKQDFIYLLGGDITKVKRRNYWKNFAFLIVSHIANEAELFVDSHFVTNAQLNQHLVSTKAAYSAPLN